jgi:cyclohexanone monooxygenase
MTQQRDTHAGVSPTGYDAVVVGAGFAGLHMLYRLRGMGLSVVALEAAPEVGGAWYWNRYPGARCDVESLVYSYSFSPELDAEWRWSERYAAQPEIQAYLRFVSERLDLRKDVRFNTRVTSALLDDDASRWTLRSESNDIISSRFCIMATGPITAPLWPDIPGIDLFAGELYHTARWPHAEPELAGKRVGVIGTGSSGTQVIPIVAERAGHLSVFLRTPNYTVPARNGPLTDEHYADWRRRREELRAAQRRGELVGSGDVLMPAELRATRMTPGTQYTRQQRREIVERRSACGGATVQQCFRDVLTNEALNAEIGDFMKEHIREVVKDPKTAELLTPRLVVGARRICVDVGYYETFNRGNVELVDVRTNPIERITSGGVRTGGREIPLDVLIAATGFDAVTGALTSIDVRGTNGGSVTAAWRDGPQTYLGLTVAGFPNLFMIGGPGSPSVLTNVVYINEFQVDFIADLIGHMMDRGLTRIEARADSQDAWTQGVNELVRGTVLEKSESWYVGANVPGKPRAILAYSGGIARYRAACEASRDNGYEGWTMSVTPRAPRSEVTA